MISSFVSSKLEALNCSISVDTYRNKHNTNRRGSVCKVLGLCTQNLRIIVHSLVAYQGIV